MISIVKILRSIFLKEEMNFDQLFNYSDPKRKKRGQSMRVRSLAGTATNTSENWNFAYKSPPSHNTTGKGWQGRITFAKNSPDVSANKIPCIVDCSCPDYRYKWAVANKDKQAGVVGATSLNKNNGQFPRVTNPYLAPGLCKHLISLKEYLRTKLNESQKPTVEEKLDEITNNNPVFTINEQ
jgi:hypothetical protein